MIKKIIYAIIILNASLNANTLGIDMNDFLCTVVGERTMNGLETSFDKQSCRKLPEIDENYEAKKVDVNFCEINTEDGTFKANYGAIPGAVKERYANRTYSGWSGEIKKIEDYVDMGIGIMTELKRCNVKISQNFNEYAKRKAVEGFDSMSFLYEGTKNPLGSMNAVLDFFDNSLEIFDCNYNCEVHKEFGGDKIGGSELLKKIKSGDFSLSEVQDDRLYNICKSSQSLCIGAGVDTKKLSEKLQDGLGIRKKDGSGFISKVEEARDKMLNKIYNNRLLQKTDRIDLLDIRKNYETMIFSGLSEELNNPRLQNTFSNLNGISSTCGAPEGRTTYNLPDLGYCSLDGIDSDFFKNRLKELEEQLKQFKDNAINVLMAQVMTIVNNSLNNIIQVAAGLELQKRINCLPIAMIRGTMASGEISPDTLNAMNEKGSSCMKDSQKINTTVDGTAGTRWLTLITESGPKIIFNANPTAGAGITAHAEEAAASAQEYISCMTSGFSAAVQSEYQKCMKGDAGINSLEFFESLKFDIIPELQKIKTMQCNLEKNDNVRDFFNLMEQVIEDNFTQVEMAAQQKYKLSVKDELLRTSQDDLSKMLSQRQKNPYSEESIIVLFIKENVRQCMREEIDNLETQNTKEAQSLTPKKLNYIQKKCMNVRIDSMGANINNEIDIQVSRNANTVDFIINISGTKLNNKIYKVSYNRLEQLYKRVKLELGLMNIDVENKLYREAYIEDDKSIEIFMDYYNSEDGIREELFNKHLTKISKKIKSIKYPKKEKNNNERNRKASIEAIIKKCSSPKLNDKLKKQCAHFKGHQSELKTYGGINNEN